MQTAGFSCFEPRKAGPVLQEDATAPAKNGFPATQIEPGASPHIDIPTVLEQAYDLKPRPARGLQAQRAAARHLQRFDHLRIEKLRSLDDPHDFSRARSPAALTGMAGFAATGILEPVRQDLAGEAVVVLIEAVRSLLGPRKSRGALPVDELLRVPIETRRPGGLQGEIDHPDAGAIEFRRVTVIDVELPELELVVALDQRPESEVAHPVDPGAGAHHLVADAPDEGQ
jgi:hypothetical protein